MPPIQEEVLPIQEEVPTQEDRTLLPKVRPPAQEVPAAAAALLRNEAGEIKSFVVRRPL